MSETNRGSIAPPRVVTLCASMEFIGSIRLWKACLERNGYRVRTPHLVDHRKSGLPRKDVFELKRREEARHFSKIRRSDAVLVLNYTKNGFTNYVGGAAFAEVAVAVYLKKKVFLVNPVPIGMPYTEELLAWNIKVWDGPRPTEGAPD